MTRKEFVRDLISKGKTEDEIVDAIIKGDIMLGVKPMTGKDDKEKKMFSVLIMKRTKKEITA